MPDKARDVVMATTPIIALTLVGQLRLIQQLYTEAIVPSAVRAEIRAGGARRVGVAALDAAPWIRAVPLQAPRRVDLLADVDRGEAEVIALAQELRAGVVILDERLARRHPKRLGLPVTETLGVLLWAKTQNYISEIAPLEEVLRLGGER